MLVAGTLDHVRDRDHRQRRAGAESGRSQTRRQPALVRKPFERGAHTGAIYTACSDTGNDSGNVKNRQIRCIGVENPAQTSADPPADDNWTRTELIDEPTF